MIEINKNYKFVYISHSAPGESDHCYKEIEHSGQECCIPKRGAPPFGIHGNSYIAIFNDDESLTIYEDEIHELDK